MTPTKNESTDTRPLLWHAAIEQLIPAIVRISTPNVSGTGVLISKSVTKSLCAIATAAHVVGDAHYWEQPIRLYHPTSKTTVLLRPGDRAIRVEAGKDEAVVVFDLIKSKIPFPGNPPKLFEKMHVLKPGVEIGWLGFPAIPKAELCFFSGKISAYIQTDSKYLVDGVAIHGVSGGPAFRINDNEVELIGVVTNYYANRSTGETLPGLAAVVDVDEFHKEAEMFKSFDEAKSKESPASAPPPRPMPKASPSDAAPQIPS
ncbi:MAG: hypothetical protein A2898_00125 [Candidatus Kerfeldbacteria bacterium RIFCSPLOWO2_01_FULL_48_11]|uniref:Serine protease n=1 Tax=Candidatus Kerfeldbacteria bacterium RIFCSPLOWO2_01_FULL_48_11 TaxID=1798543 RepID=A0A1G2B5A0_9BACT|nr:MAG: hypothetical protein UY34_C0020G0003 [Parcubacteria group bacterium GW2011_GWA2_48_9]KKW13579.1 MAG: hypothetical protein UY52_C0040G0006 [Parcubacteria group bacterium GW2011_GWC2_49_9]OGY84363.1 MAG: hypothetical protein A2898_00125 [Candidatus Kerfeldbacteria bacterium RIFCSPLOWO2_01_FULL_48_11]HCJ52556.1 serine protease [Candidatus Kerfeldbacteria bacterium]HCM67826.1 serine protease [Candidatus Kerfeldbacteria bacterium]